MCIFAHVICASETVILQYVFFFALFFTIMYCFSLVAFVLPHKQLHSSKMYHPSKLNKLTSFWEKTKSNIKKEWNKEHYNIRYNFFFLFTRNLYKCNWRNKCDIIIYEQCGAMPHNTWTASVITLSDIFVYKFV